MSRNLFVILVVLLALVLPTPSAHAAGSIMTCNEASLLSALAGGGNVTFYADCTIT